jgi:hypothetical protein
MELEDEKRKTHLGTRVVFQITHALLLTIILDKLSLSAFPFLLLLVVLAVLVLQVQIPLFALVQVQHLSPHVLVDVEWGVSISLGSQSLQKLLFDRLFKVGRGEGFAFSSGLASVKLLLDPDELRSGVSGRSVASSGMGGMRERRSRARCGGRMTEPCTYC